MEILDNWLGNGQFAVEVLFTIYVLQTMTSLTENQLLPSLQNIATKYKINKDIAGCICALGKQADSGSTVPEFSTNVISNFSPDKRMVEFGIGIVVGAGVFCKYWNDFRFYDCVICGFFVFSER
jgi:hypothetical protein